MNQFYYINKKKILTMSLLITCLSFVTSLVGLYSTGGPGSSIFTNIHGELVELYGIGIYQRDSISVAAQGIAADFITLVIGIPLILLSSIKSYQGSKKSSFILLGTLGYFLYTYMSYVFLWMYNPMFIVYVVLMSLSLFTFILMMMSFNLQEIKYHIKGGLPIRFLSVYQIIIGIFIGILWLGKIAPTVINHSTPVGLEHYTTLVIQGMDLAFVVPIAILSGLLLLKRKPMGYLLTSVVAVKGFTMLLSISAMIVNQFIHGVQVSTVEAIMFPIFNLFAIYVFFIFIRNIDDNDLTLVKVQ